jgi:hypothetical protein
MHIGRLVCNAVVASLPLNRTRDWGEGGVNFVVSLVLLLAALVPLSLAESGATAGVAQSVVARSSQVAGENESYDASYEASQWWSPGDAHTLGAAEFDNPFGKVGVVYDGTLNTRGHPFFEPLSENGRACVTCHQPADGMGLSLRSIKERWETTGGKDPLFAAVDGSNCPNLPQGDPKSHSLLLERGLFLVALPWPPRNLDGTLIEPEFTIEFAHAEDFRVSPSQDGGESQLRHSTAVPAVQHQRRHAHAEGPRRGAALQHAAHGG